MLNIDNLTPNVTKRIKSSLNPIGVRTDEELNTMIRNLSPTQAFEHFLNDLGIQGFAEQILHAVIVIDGAIIEETENGSPKN